MSIIEGFIPLTAVVLSLLFPIIAIVYGIKASIRKKQYETELRRLIIENHTDLETAKALIEKQEPKSDSLRSGSGSACLVYCGVEIAEARAPGVTRAIISKTYTLSHSSLQKENLSRQRGFFVLNDF